MKKLFYILFLFSFFAKAQTPAPLFNVGKYVVTDYHAHYMGSVNLSSFISSSAYYITKRPLISGFIGLGLSFLITYTKEEVYDGMLGKGTNSISDKDGNGRGSAAGGLISFGIEDTLKRRKQNIDTLRYQFLSRKPCPACDVDNACLTVYIEHTH